MTGLHLASNDRSVRIPLQPAGKKQTLLDMQIQGQNRRQFYECKSQPNLQQSPVHIADTRFSDVSAKVRLLYA